MRVAVVNTDYAPFLEALYGSSPGLESASYAEQQRARADSLFGVADFFSANLRALGHEAFDLHFNNEPMQLAWAREHAPALARGREPRPVALRRVSRKLRGGTLLDRIVATQLRALRPDVILNQDLRSVPPAVLARARRGALLVGQHGATAFDDYGQFAAYDLVLSQVRPTVERFRAAGVPAEELPLAFEATIPARLTGAEPLRDVAFVGSLFAGVHDERIRLLEHVCSEVPGVAVFSAGVDGLAATSPIRACWAGPAWGRRMYEVLLRSRISLNRHGGAFAYADNCRLYEATGVGSALLTDALPHLGDLFELEAEVATYADAEGCVARIRELLADEPARAAIAAAGRARTLAEHTYAQRMEQLVELLEPRLRRAKAG